MDFYVEKHKLTRAIGAFPCNGNIDDYIKCLEDNGIEYFEINTQKESGRRIRLVVPICNLRKMKRSDYKKLFNGVL